MLPIHKIIWHEWREKRQPVRVPEAEAMTDPEQIRAYVKAYEWGGPASALQLHHLRELSTMIRPGDTVVDLACGPGPLMLELAPLFPDCQFIGVDLSQPMLDALAEIARERSLDNVRVLCEDIRSLPSLQSTKVDMLITTSALHHLPDEKSLSETLQCMNSLLHPDAGLYAFDFGQLRSVKTRNIMVREVAKYAPTLTALDYDASLQAAFAVEDVIYLTRKHLHRPLDIRTSRFVDFFYFIRSAQRSTIPNEMVRKRVKGVLRNCSPRVKMEYFMLQAMSRYR